MDAFTPVCGDPRGTSELRARRPWWFSPDLDPGLRTWPVEMSRRGAVRFALNHSAGVWELIAFSDDGIRRLAQAGRRVLCPWEADHLLDIWPEDE